ncbi:MAG: aminotransferase class I/II-fold pyridoxal phosphate-dependent enzyme [Saprospiraceae bacterium]
MIEGADRLKYIEDYYFFGKLVEIKSMIENGIPVINFGIGSPDLQPPDSAILKIKQAFDDKNHGYQPYKGINELRESFAELYSGFFDVTLDPSTEILPLAGSKEGIMHISLAFLNKGDKVLIPDPGYLTYHATAKIVEAEPVFYDLNEENNYKCPVSELEKMDLSGVKLMWVNYPHMPTGAIVDAEYFKELSEFGERNNILIVNDNAYGLIGNHSPLSILNYKNDYVLELNSLSKSFNIAGWRIGMVGGAEYLIKKILKIKSNFDSGTNYSIQKGAIEAVTHGQKWISNLNDIYNERRKLLNVLISKIGLEPKGNDSGLFVWAKVNDSDKNGEMVCDDLLYQNNIFAVPGQVFGKSGDKYIRFSLCLPKEKIIEAIERF